MLQLAKVVQDYTKDGVRRTTMVVLIPLSLWQPFLRLKLFKQDLVPFDASIDDLLRQVAEKPYIPRSVRTSEKAIQAWLTSRTTALSQVRKLANLGMPEQDCAYLIAPFVLRIATISAKEWGNFSRDVSAISPDLQAIYDAIVAALRTSEPQFIGSDDEPLSFQKEDIVAILKT